MASSNLSRKRSIGEMDLSPNFAVAASSVMTNNSNKSSSSNNKRRNSSGSTFGRNGNGNMNMNTSTSTSTSTNHTTTINISSALESVLERASNDYADKVSYASLANTVEILKKERFECHMKKLPLLLLLLTAKNDNNNNKHSNDAPADVQSKIAVLDNRMKEITDSIVRYESKMGIPMSVDV
ncbi:MAG: hypothetical protein SGBAC_013464 [Bacillariaceae sp.]